jgi:hypothetical protein
MAEQLSMDYTLDEIERRILALLRARRGRSQAIRARDLGALVGMGRNGESENRRNGGPRAVQEIVRRLREEHGCPILSSAGKPPGYWWAATAEELDICIREQKRKAISTLVVLRALRRHRARLMGQGELAAGRRQQAREAA